MDVGKLLPLSMSCMTFAIIFLIVARRPWVWLKRNRMKSFSICYLIRLNPSLAINEEKTILFDIRSDVFFFINSYPGLKPLITPVVIFFTFPIAFSAAFWIFCVVFLTFSIPFVMPSVTEDPLQQNNFQYLICIWIIR